MALPMPPNTTCDIYRVGSTPPAAPDVQAICHIRPAYQEGLERGDSEAAKFRYTHVLSVGLSTDVRDDFNEYTGTAGNRDLVYVPDKSGVGFNVNFVERLNRGWSTDHLRVYLDRKLPTWPIPANVIVGGASTTILGAGGPSFGGQAVQPITTNLFVSGGASAGGAATVYSVWNWGPSAGAEVGGQAAAYHVWNWSPSSGFQSGGQAGASFTPGSPPPPPTPGTSCSDAPTVALDTDYDYDGDTSAHWFAIQTASGSDNIHVIITGTSPGVDYQLWSDCPATTLVFQNGVGGGSVCRQWSGNGSLNYLRIGPQPHESGFGDYTIRFEVGPCP